MPASIEALSTTAAWNHGERTKFTNAAGYALAGTNLYDGKKMANAPEISGSAVLSYRQPIMNDFDLFMNLATVSARSTAALRSSIAVR